MAIAELGPLAASMTDAKRRVTGFSECGDNQSRRRAPDQPEVHNRTSLFVDVPPYPLQSDDQL